MTKTTVLIIAFLAFCNTTFAQMEIGYHYKIKTFYCLGKDLDLRYGDVTNCTAKFIKGKPLKAALKADSMGIVKIDFWGFKEGNCPAQESSQVNCSDDAGKYFFQIKKRNTLKEIVEYESIPYAVLEVGAVTIPFKYWKGRDGNPNNTSTDFNAGVYLGRKWGRQRFYYDKDKNHKSVALTLAIFSGPSKIDITKDNITDTLKFKKASSQLNLSVGTGAMLSYRSFNIGVFSGYDIPLTTEARNWQYANKRWIGFGVGYSINLLGK